jgi:hypothetical protein
MTLSRVTKGSVLTPVADRARDPTPVAGGCKTPAASPVGASLTRGTLEGFRLARVLRLDERCMLSTRCFASAAKGHVTPWAGFPREVGAFSAVNGWSLSDLAPREAQLGLPAGSPSLSARKRTAAR